MKSTSELLSLTALSAFIIALAGCATIPIGDIVTGCSAADKCVLEGKVRVDWHREDQFVYVRTNDPLRFTPAFMSTAIVPERMYTDGGSVPRVLWSIPGLSPWGLGPAYIIHDWIFKVHRCGLAAPPEVQNITFEQSARILAEVGMALIDAGLIDHDKLNEITWGVSTRYARDLWDRPGTAEECIPPPELSLSEMRRLGVRTIVEFTLPTPR